MIELKLHLPRSGFTLDVDLQLPAQGVTALFGPSGCGKTTVLRALAGLERAAGRIALGGEVWQDDAQRLFVPTHQRALGYVIQESALFPHLNVRRNLEYGRKRIAASERHIDLDQVVALLGIGGLMDRQPDTLSGGERQRVAIARALATSPRLLLMDEPLAALDAARKAEVLPFLDRLHQELSIPIVYVSHALEEVARLAHHVVLLDSGRVVGEGSLADVMARLDLPTARGEGAGVVLDAVVAEHDRPWQLSRLAIGPKFGPDFSVWARDSGLPLGRAAYAQRPACRTTWAHGPSGPGLYVQGPPVAVDAPPVRIGGLMLYLVPPEIVVRPSEVTVEPPQIHGGEVTTPEAPTEG